MTGGLDQSRAPILETLRRYLAEDIYPLHTPGHKGGRFADGDLVGLVGAEGLSFDLPSMTATDNLFHPSGCLREAQELAAELFGAAGTFFLTAGSTLGIAAAMLAAVPDGGTVVLPRNIHRSVVAALVLSGAWPRFVEHDWHAEYGALGVTAAALAAALDTSPRPAAVLLTCPSYYGLAGDLAPLAAVCHARDIPLIVDEAHGAHLPFLPPGGPLPALAAGADLVVQSCHKTLGSLVGSAQLHVSRDSLIAAERIQNALNLLQTTSASYLLLASLDGVRRRMWREGRELFAGAVAAAARLEARLDEIPGIRVLRPAGDPTLAGHRRDPLRLVVNVGETGWTGYEVERHLRVKFRVEDEMADLANVVYVLSPQDDPDAYERLVAGLQSVSGSPRQSGKPTAAGQAEHRRPDAGRVHMVQSPRAAALARHESVAADAAVGRVSSEMVMFYPPGIPLLMPGQEIDRDTVDRCRELLAAGAHCYASDASLATFRVVA